MDVKKLQMKQVETIHLNYRNKEELISPCVTQRLVGMNLKRLNLEHSLYGEKAIIPNAKKKLGTL